MLKIANAMMAVCLLLCREPVSSEGFLKLPNNIIYAKQVLLFMRISFYPAACSWVIIL